MKLYKTAEAIILEKNNVCYLISTIGWDELLNQDNLYQYLESLSSNLPIVDAGWMNAQKFLAPIHSQEVWAAGVTYLRSMEARKEESKDAGGGTFYDKVYNAERPEIFFKATAQRCVGSREKVRIRKDSSWNVPEPELTLVLNSKAAIIGYTVGNDMSSRSIEGENPLYLPQAKTYDGSAAVGPCIFLTSEPLSPDTKIEMQISRSGQNVYQDEVEIGRMKRGHQELAEFLFRECSFPHGAYLMTGTCLVPPNEFTLLSKDEISITIGPIGTLINEVE